MRNKFVVLKSISGTDFYLSIYSRITLMELASDGLTLLHFEGWSFHLQVKESPAEIIAKFEELEAQKGPMYTPAP